ncbi:Ld132-like protein [Clanis bilineata nucleopolyhedrovirus]|uniref:Ld132-like protein n=1 Tax=Clanis bilineata nucleopolyhedrovirus TaxID=1307957 RepID=Q0N446_9ABAC|nr:Ld132-like protein [Clanis bilineata nucleopolyhedrovirus]ABF47397.1 Ld132-like protein [Clanis bilineata nucleopolyhedrovirus]
MLSYKRCSADKSIDIESYFIYDVNFSFLYKEGLGVVELSQHKHYVRMLNQAFPIKKYAREWYSKTKNIHEWPSTVMQWKYIFKNCSVNGTTSVLNSYTRRCYCTHKQGLIYAIAVKFNRWPRNADAFYDRIINYVHRGLKVVEKTSECCVCYEFCQSVTAMCNHYLCDDCCKALELCPYCRRQLD